MMTGKKIPLAPMGVLAFGSAHKIPEIPWNPLNPMKPLENPLTHWKTLENTWKHLKTLEKHWKTLDNTWKHLRNVEKIDKCWKMLKNIENTENTSKNTCQFPLAPMGSSLPGLHTLNPPLSSPSTLAEIFQRMCLGGGTKKLKIYPINLLRQF